LVVMHSESATTTYLGIFLGRFDVRIFSERPTAFLNVSSRTIAHWDSWSPDDLEPSYLRFGQKTSPVGAT